MSRSSTIARTRLRSLALLSVLLFPASARTQQSAGTDSTVSLTGFVTDRSGLPLAAVEVIVDSIHRDLTGTDGAFTISSVAAGLIQFTARRIGYIPVTAVVQADAGLIVKLAVRLMSSAVELETVVVSGKRVIRTLSENGYYKRANLGNGNFLSPEYLARTSASISSLMYMIPSVRIERGKGGTAVAVGRRGSEFCALSVFVDGWYLSYASSIGIDDIVGRYDVLAVEVYSHPTQVPMEFLGRGGSSTECGAMFIWTKPIQTKAAGKKPAR